MATDDQIGVVLTADTSGLNSGMTEATAIVKKATKEMGSGLDEVSARASKASFAMKGFHLAGHEAFTEMGVNGRLARVLGGEVEHLAVGLGSAAAAFGGIALAGVLAYQMYEHLSKSSAQSKQATEAASAATEKEILSLYQNTEQRRALTEQIARENEQKRIGLTLDNQKRINEANKAVEEAQKQVDKLNKSLQVGIGINNGNINSTEKSYTAIGLKVVETTEATLDLARANQAVATAQEHVKTVMQENALLAQKPKEADTKGSSNMQQYEQELEKRKAAYEGMKDAQGNWQIWSLTQTQKYWEQVSQMASLSAEDQKTAIGKALIASRQAQDQAHKQEHADQLRETAESIQTNEARYKSEIEAAKTAYEAGAITLEEKVQLEKNAVDKKFALDELDLEHKLKISSQDLNAQRDAAREIVANEESKVAALKAIDEKYLVDKKKQQDELLKIVVDEQKSEIDHHRAMYEEDLKTQVALGRMTQTQMEQLLAQRLDADFNAEAVNLANRLENAGTEVTKREQIYSELLTLQNQYELKRKQANDKAAIDEENAWKNTVAPITNALDQNVTNMLMGTMRLRGGMRTIFNDIERFALQSITKMVTDWMAGEVTKLGITEAINSVLIALGIKKAAADTSTNTLANTTAVTSAKITAAAVIPAETGAAAMGAAAAVAPTPSTGPVLAAAAFAAMQALGVSALALASAAGGYDIGNINPITQLHAREMVLPQKHADVIRGLADGGMGGNKGGSTTHVFTGLNPDHLYQGSAFIGAIKKLSRDGHLGSVRFS